MQESSWYCSVCLAGENCHSSTPYVELHFVRISRQAHGLHGFFRQYVRGRIFMAMGQLALAVLLTAAASPDTVLLTPDNVAEYDYFFVCGVLDEGEKRRVGRTEPVAEKVDAFLRSLGGEKSRVRPP